MHNLAKWIKRQLCKQWTDNSLTSILKVQLLSLNQFNFFTFSFFTEY